jgi:3-oxoacyl-[acyl-carrier protein] reductase
VIKTERRRALITGASRGIGLAIAKMFQASGVDIITPARDDMDLLSNSSIDAYISALPQPIDILVNNAGINVIASLAEVTDRNIEEALQINLLAPLRLSRAIAPAMIERHYGRIVNISSIWGVVTKAGRVTYSAAKSGLGGVTRTLAVELAPYNVLVNAVAPGYVNTVMTLQNNTRAQIEAIEKTIPLGRMAKPEEIAEVVAFLASENNTYLTGQLLLVDGGYTCL